MNENLLDETDLGDVSTEAVVDIVSDVMDVGNIVVGKGNELFRIRGRLFIEYDEAYDRLAVAMGRIGLTPLFRSEKSDDLVIVIRSSPDEKTGNPLLNILLFAITLVTVLYAGSMHSSESIEILRGADFTDGNSSALLILKVLWTGWPFALSLL